LGHPSKCQRVFASSLPYCSDVAQRKVTKLCTMFGRLLSSYTIYTFWGLLSSYGILSGAIFTLRQCLALSYIGSVTARHYSSGRQHDAHIQFMAALRRRCGNYIFALLFLLSFFFGCLPYFHTLCGRENLGCRSETCCTWLAENTTRNVGQCPT